MTKDEAIKEIAEYIKDTKKCISENDEYLRGYESALRLALEIISEIDPGRCERCTPD